ncbi:signal peptidase II [Kerstersia gyiorum]|jgi:signal peptidase II|uniref:Lipoprotein signal peptidase n=1 Tax=Kerstersia gyiorum TaxID=206506 RepID=A0A4Q7MP17_9BURK|nr:signal peptidase II [Kerstersia gyiorum]AZV93533.1 signal peptidase II [Bordetella sp. J329]MCO7640784.1 signal peptidase II [Pseudomonas sp. S 311-6]KAB0543341.1 lipoprotein signal peptidase [Kerstersia gyiorum]MCH4271144.1 signal peptidase II [Kerstersia gyiorum]MCI1228421.1 signal peptidase II [Kerstersia gyiorum]
MNQGKPASNRLSAPDFWRWVALAVLLIGLDQVTKYHFNTVLQYGQRMNLLPFFDFTLLYNEGAAFSFLAGADGWQRWFFTALGFVASALILFLLRRHAAQRRFSLALTLILGGALGNVIDRLQHGHVVDFLLFYWNNAYFPAFNFADICITVGAILLLWDELARARRVRAGS